MVHDAGAGAATVPRRTVPDAQSVAGLLADDAVGGQALVALVRRERVDARQPEPVVGTGQGVAQTEQHLLGAQCCRAASVVPDDATDRADRPAAEAAAVVGGGGGGGWGGGGGGVVGGSVGERRRRLSGGGGAAVWSIHRHAGSSSTSAWASAVTPGSIVSTPRRRHARAPRRRGERGLPPTQHGREQYLIVASRNRPPSAPRWSPREGRGSACPVLDDRATPSAAGASAVTSRRRPSQSRNSRVPRTCWTTHDGSPPSG